MTFPDADNAAAFIHILKVSLASSKGRDFATKLREDLFNALHRNVDNFSAAQQISREFFLLKGGMELARVAGVVAQTYAALVRDAYSWVGDAEEKKLAEQFGVLFTHGLVEGMEAAKAGDAALRAEGWKPGD